MQAKIYLSPSMVRDFVSVASKCDFDIDIASYNRYCVDAKSIIGVMGLDMNVPLTVTYDGFNSDFEGYLKQHAVAC